jgi:hypothetical protein
MRRSIRSLAWFAIAAQAGFVASWIVAGALQRDYSEFDSDVSALAAHGMRHPWIVMAGLVLLGLGIAALAPGVRATLPARRATVVAVALFALAGAAIVVAGLAPPECDLAHATCRARFDAGKLPWQTSVHIWAGLVSRVTLLLTPFALARALWPRPTGLGALSAGINGVAISIAALALYSVGGASGLIERIELGVLHLWVVIVAAGVLYETRSAPKLSAATPLRPRDFFGSAWSGAGVALGVPAFVWRPLAPRFEFTRETTWNDDELALVHDRAVLSDGHVEERLRYAHFVDATHIHVSSDDWPGGADVTIDEHGYRISSYNVLVPIGPIRVMLKSRDQASVQPDGTLLYISRLRWHGLPIARLELRARPVDTATPQSQLSALTARLP